MLPRAAQRRVGGLPPGIAAPRVLPPGMARRYRGRGADGLRRAWPGATGGRGADASRGTAAVV